MLKIFFGFEVNPLVFLAPIITLPTKPLQTRRIRNRRMHTIPLLHLQSLNSRFLKINTHQPCLEFLVWACACEDVPLGAWIGASIFAHGVVDPRAQICDGGNGGRVGVGNEEDEARYKLRVRKRRVVGASYAGES